MPLSIAHWTGTHRKWMKSIEFKEETQKLVFDEYYTAILEHEAKIDRLKEKIEELAAEERYAEKVSKLKCFKGIDTLTALTFVAEIGDFRRFSTGSINNGVTNLMGMRM